MKIQALSTFILIGLAVFCISHDQGPAGIFLTVIFGLGGLLGVYGLITRSKELNSESNEPSFNSGLSNYNRESDKMDNESFMSEVGVASGIAIGTGIAASIHKRNDEIIESIREKSKAIKPSKMNRSHDEKEEK